MSEQLREASHHQYDAECGMERSKACRYWTLEQRKLVLRSNQSHSPTGDSEFGERYLSDSIVTTVKFGVAGKWCFIFRSCDRPLTSSERKT